MKVHFALILASALLPAACGQVTANDTATAKSALASMTSKEQAANDLYLDDATDSAAEDSSSSIPGTSSETKDDIKANRLAQMAEMLLKQLDADASGALSLEEFLVCLDKRAEETAVDAETLAKMRQKMTEDFNKFAGEDKVLSSAELQSLVKSYAPRVSQHREEKFPGKQEERVQKNASELIKEFDKNADGKLDSAEIEALLASRKSQLDDFRQKKDKLSKEKIGQRPEKGNQSGDSIGKDGIGKDGTNTDGVGTDGVGTEGVGTDGVGQDGSNEG